MPPPSVAVVIPWRPSPGRELNLAAAAAGLRRTFGTWPPNDLGIAQVWVELADSGHDPFHRAASRNAGVRAAQSDVLVVCDADVIVDPTALHAALTAARDGKLHLPYTECHMLSQTGTMQVHDGMSPDLADCAKVFPNSVGGCVVVAHDTWRAVGGWDERFATWGFEDTAFWCAVDTIFGTVRHQGVLYDLWHPDARGIGSESWRRGMALCDRYTDARGKPDEIRALIEERHANHHR